MSDVGDWTFMIGDTTVIWTGSRDSYLASWFFNAWQFRPGRDDQPYWVWSVEGLKDCDWVLRRVGDPVPYVVVSEDLFASSFRRDV